MLRNFKKEAMKPKVKFFYGLENIEKRIFRVFKSMKQACFL